MQSFAIARKDNNEVMVIIIGELEIPTIFITKKDARNGLKEFYDKAYHKKLQVIEVTINY